jgi:UDP-N-acetylglucosamine enolpyruvyl transferase
LIFLKKIGAKITFSGTRGLNIHGVKNLKSTTHKVIFDRIEAGTYIIASALTKGKLKIKNVIPKIISNEISLLNKMGVVIDKGKKYITVTRPGKIKNTNITTSPYPGFPTDLQAQIMVLMTQANGISTVKEKIFENRFMHVPRIKKNGCRHSNQGQCCKNLR